MMIIAHLKKSSIIYSKTYENDKLIVLIEF
jgi:hypothetical protein